MTTSEKEYMSCADTAKLVRKALKVEFPGIKFSVRSSVYSMGASVDVSWTDGPTASVVKDVCRLYEGATFDGMQDLKEYHSSVLVDDSGPREVMFGADFVMTHRDISNEWKGEIERMIGDCCGMAVVDLYDQVAFPVIATWDRDEKGRECNPRFVPSDFSTTYGSELLHRYTSLASR